MVAQDRVFECVPRAWVAFEQFSVEMVAPRPSGCLRSLLRMLMPGAAAELACEIRLTRARADALLRLTRRGS